MAGKFKAFNGPFPTTAAQAVVATGTSIKTMLQLKATSGLIITGWGFSVDTALTTGASVVELVNTKAINATVTAFVAGDVTPLATPSAASVLTNGTAASGYTASAEGTIVATDMFDVVSIPIPAAAAPQLPYYSKYFVGDERPYLPAGEFLRVRATMGLSVGMRCWIAWIER